MLETNKWWGEDIIVTTSTILIKIKMQKLRLRG